MQLNCLIVAVCWGHLPNGGSSVIQNFYCGSKSLGMRQESMLKWLDFSQCCSNIVISIDMIPEGHYNFCGTCEFYPSGDLVACPQLMDESLACLLGLKLHAGTQ